MSKTLFGFDIEQQWDYENGFYLTSHLTRIPKMLAHYELYKSIINLPGQVVECGVFKGASFIRFCTFREVLESPYSRKIIGFDAFGKFPQQENVEDQSFVEKFEGTAGQGISIHELEEVLAHKKFQNYELIQGDITQTIPDYVANHPELKISLLHIDVDVYQPSVTILNHLFDRVVSGGLLVFDDFATVSGETKAIDEFFVGKDSIIEKLSLSHIPSYVRKNNIIVKQLKKEVLCQLSPHP
ncbi:DTDP-6-deoxy-L-hexose 3-O-methyltransferase [Crocosphaera watsonii WH 0005]|uniref:dTDP-6-deoxy-L-hexose 3-O-methyltransferase n=1 Tax=Crocosphaera watsonii WH 0005 TaxID=423472 RepID=T2INC5_CROWT|nr:TylF/MycF/NovP-related O-methyltransferase [Crocosphaera watsonii]CCQ54404.1 DTDP-6-deoxy-L-hexose 3-O-methyltransferase [Crocosphaera watsonii WH 0005]